MSIPGFSICHWIFFFWHTESQSHWLLCYALGFPLRRCFRLSVSEGKMLRLFTCAHVVVSSCRTSNKYIISWNDFVHRDTTSLTHSRGSKFEPLNTFCKSRASHGWRSTSDYDSLSLSLFRKVEENAEIRRQADNLINLETFLLEMILFCSNTWRMECDCFRHRIISDFRGPWKWRMN